MSAHRKWVDPRLISAWREFIANYPAELAVTLTYNYHKANTGVVLPSKVYNDLDRYHRDLDIELLGSYCSKWLAPDRSQFVGFIENANSNTHIHLCWRHPPSTSPCHFLERAEIVWRSKIAGSGSVCVKPIRDDGWANYITENIEEIVEAKPELFVASRFIPTTK